MEVRKNFGNGHKESIYQNAFAEELESRNISFEKEKNIKVYSPKTGKVVGYYRPDFLIDNKIVVELKAVEKIPKMFIDQLYDYLRNSAYELGYFINFASPKLYTKRIIYTNDRKSFVSKVLVAFSFLFVVFGVFDNAYAARVFFEPAVGSYQVGDSFILSLLLDTEGLSINAVDMGIQVPKLLKIKGISKSGSVIQLWVQEPSFSGGTINLTGGIPGGVTTSKGIIAKINFEAAAIGDGNLAFTPGSLVLLNDGLGTKFELKTASGPMFQVVPKPKETATVSPELKPKETPVAVKNKVEVKQDNKKPEKFEIIAGTDPRVFKGEQFIAFFTIDKDSGVDRYEIKEGDSGYKIAQSPYLLSDQEKMRTVIRIRAYDAAGNYKESIYPGISKRIWWQLITLFNALI